MVCFMVGMFLATPHEWNSDAEVWEPDLGERLPGSKQSDLRSDHQWRIRKDPFGPWLITYAVPVA